MTWNARATLFVILVGVGLFILGGYLGVYYWPPIRQCRAIFCDPYHWQILAIGGAFLCAGLSFVIPEKFRLLGKVNAAVLLFALFAGIIGSFVAAR